MFQEHPSSALPFPSLEEIFKYENGQSLRSFLLFVTMDWNGKLLLRDKKTGGMSSNGMIKPLKTLFFPVSNPCIGVCAVISN